MPDCQMLGDHAAHRHTHHRRAQGRQVLEDAGSVVGQKLHRVGAGGGLRQSNPTLVQHQALEMLGELAHIPDKGVVIGAQSWDQEKWRPLPYRMDRQLRAVAHLNATEFSRGGPLHRPMVSVSGGGSGRTNRAGYTRTMPVFFVPVAQVSPTGEVQILDRDAWHISRVLRSRQGELVTVVVEDGTEHDIRLESLRPDQVTGVIVASRRTRREPTAQLHLLQALPKGQGMASVCEQVAELGAVTIWPVLSERTVPRPEPAQAALRRERWATISREAAQLAGRHRIPEVRPIAPVLDALEMLRASEPKLQAFTCHDGELRQGLNSVAWDDSLPTAVLVGPEGGFSAAEVQLLASHGSRPVSLGPRNLRSTLAAVVALTVLLARAGDMEAHGG